MLISIPQIDFADCGIVPALDGLDYDDLLESVWSAEEGSAVAPPPDLTVSEWADANRVLQDGISRNPGPWQTSYTPYLKEIMDAYTDESVRHLVFAAGTQLGKTEMLYNVAGYIIDHDPYPTLMVSPREDDAKLVSRTRIQPMIRDCSCLREKMSKRRGDFKTLEMKFPGMWLYLVGANSLSALASKPCRNVLRDEIDKYPDRLGADADPLSKSEERAKSYWDIRKIFDVSSPSFEDVGILKQLSACDVINVIHHPCPHCKQYIRLYMPQIKYDDQPGNKHRKMIAKRSAHYVCQRCGGIIENDARQWMIANYRFIGQENIAFGIDKEQENKPIGQLDFVPEAVGFWVSSMSSPMLSWGDIAAKWVEAVIERDETGETLQLQNMVTDWLDEPWLENIKKSTVEQILERKCEIVPLIVPSWAVALTCGIDVQKYGFWVTVWAFDKKMRSHLVYYDFLVSWDDIDRLVFNTTWAVEGAERRMGIWRAAMDIGGGKDSQVDEDWTKTEEIVTWIRENGRGVVFPVKGMSVNNTGQKIKQSVMDKMPGAKGGKIPGGLTLYLIDTYMMKETVFYRFDSGPTDPQPLTMHSETGEDFGLQITAEEKRRNKNGHYEYVRVKKDNHLLDCTVYAHAAADIQWMGGVPILEDVIYVDEKVQVYPNPAKLSSARQEHGMRQAVRGFQRPGWLNRR